MKTEVKLVAMRDALGQALVELGSKIPELVVLDADVSASTSRLIEITAKAMMIISGWLEMRNAGWNDHNPSAMTAKAARARTPTSSVGMWTNERAPVNGCTIENS